MAMRKSIAVTSEEKLPGTKPTLKTGGGGTSVTKTATPRTGVVTGGVGSMMTKTAKPRNASATKAKKKPY